MDKCLHILPMNKLSGAERMALTICKNMNQYEPIVVCGGIDLGNVFNENGIKSYSLKFSNKNFLKIALNLKKIVKENNIKILHAHDNVASISAYLVKKLFKLDIKVISHIHNCYPYLKSDGLNKRIDRFIRNKYDHNIICGKFVYDFYKENADYLLEEKLTILSNAIDLYEIKEKDFYKDKEIISKYNIPKDKLILGFIGRLDEQKGIIPFIREFKENISDFKDCVVLIVGSGDKEKEIKTLIRDLNLGEFFILTGFQKNVYKFYPLIDIFFLPSLYEGLPMVLLEAMAFKKAIISMDVGSISEVINQNTGVLIKDLDYKEFINNIKNIKVNKNLLNRYGYNASRFIYSNYNIKSYVDKLENIYQKVSRV